MSYESQEEERGVGKMRKENPAKNTQKRPA